MRKALTAALMLIAAATANAAAGNAPMEEIVVTGEHAGPGMWQVRHPDHPGHTLWILGDPPLLPKGMYFRSKKVADVAEQSNPVQQRKYVVLEIDVAGCRELDHLNALAGATNDDPQQTARLTAGEEGRNKVADLCK